MKHALAGMTLIGTVLAVSACGRHPHPAPQAAAAPAATSMPADAGATSLVGAWRSRVQFADGAFAGVKDLELLYAYNQGGTMTESSNYDGAPPVPPAYGAWRQTGPNRYQSRYRFFVTKPPAAFADVAKGGGWMPNGYGVLNETIELAPDGRRFESSIVLELFDAAGKPVEGGGNAIGRGERLGF